MVGLLLGGRYELTERLAIGGMGEVWVATDLHLRRDVAAKVLREEFAGDEHFLGRLHAEAVNAASLSHQNIAAMYDYGEERGSGYLVMELVHGDSLEDLLRREHTLQPAQVLPILAQAARALHAAHMAGVVHRDVKPSNLLITPDGYVKITDFGISLGSNQAPMTAAGMVMGTAQYLPPEQAMGRAATGAGDIYALGVVAYESLVGHRPFTGKTQVDIAFAHVKEPVPPMPERLDPRVREVVLQMLAKDPEQRPRSAASLARTLEHIAASLEVAVEPERPATSVGGTPAAGMTTAGLARSGPLTVSSAPAADAGPGPAAGSAVSPAGSSEGGSGAGPASSSATGSAGDAAADPVGSPASATAGSPASSAHRSPADGSAADTTQSPDGADEQDMEPRWQPMPEPAAAPAGGEPVRPPTTPRRPRAAAPGGRPAQGSSQSRHDQRPTGAAHRQGQPTNPLVSELQQRFGSLWWWPLAAVAVVVIVVIIAILTVWFTRLGAADAAW
ncbi:MAG TPA: serine/threonine-protein kinase, partial [Ruania sp.]|nr:serine/threonine-protein kinase [Ruania sp.]